MGNFSYKDIAISFSNEDKQSIGRFMFNQGFCDPLPCLIKLELGGGNVLIAQ
ncbi:hypothetical protein [Bathymodiolus japonicus methanotrophic gill symbiont]|uniref:hypothetical protein n=1 Tax=Bathymodiolus japonicus methanotrophic gill symbiont TaxID=113269 RepID=UPI001C8DA5BC|nr:hypothetical protein [Bathymodiolus japonicus methanotrophic gill symbiont]